MTTTREHLSQIYQHSQSGYFVEAKDPGEYDQEGNMAKGQLKTMIDAAQELHKMMGDDDNLPEWVQSKITKATDYIDTVRDYMKSEVSEGPARDRILKQMDKASGRTQADREADAKKATDRRKAADKDLSDFKKKMGS